MKTLSKNSDLPKLMLSILFITLLIITTFWIIQPFILAFTWASMVVIATWPILPRLQRLLWGRRSLAVLLMSLLLLLLFIIPVVVVINSMVDNSRPLLEWINNTNNWHLPDLLWLKKLPLFGEQLYNLWYSLIADGGKALLNKVQPYAGQASSWFITKAANAGFFILQCLLMLLFSVILYSRGEQIASAIRHFAFRLAEEHGDTTVILAAQAIRAVALGVVVTALAQSILGGIGLAISGIPYATVLTVLMFICCVAQLGPLLILIPALVWLYFSGDMTDTIVLLVWSTVVATMDAFLRPLLIRMGADLPLLLILSGVIGGLLAFGMIGLFIGPVVLAVTYRLLSAWVKDENRNLS